VNIVFLLLTDAMHIVQVERDFNCIIENAVTFNFASDIVNKEAIRLYHACRNVFAKWAKKKHIYCCIKCSDDHVPEDPNLQLLICDGCCEAIHARCFYETRNSRLLYQQSDVHPFRQDEAVFCTIPCYNTYHRNAARFQLSQARPPLRQLQGELAESIASNSSAPMQQQQMIQTVPAKLPTKPPQASFDYSSYMPSCQPSILHRSGLDEARLSEKALLTHASGSQEESRDRPHDGPNVGSKRPFSAEPSDSLQTQRPGMVQIRGEFDSNAQEKQVQGVRDSLGLVQAMRAAKTAEKMCLERFQTAQKALQVCALEHF
jgi:hypothetical protein